MDAESLTGKLLIAMPGMEDPRFARSVVLICHHDADGAMGLTVNRPHPRLGFRALLAELGIEAEAPQPVRVGIGGPVERMRGFVLHRPDGAPEDDGTEVTPSITLTTSRTILEALAAGHGPQDAVLLLGYAGWEAGQLEREIRANGWLVGSARDEIVFGRDDGAKWAAALGTLGVSPSVLSAQAGRA